MTGSMHPVWLHTDQWNWIESRSKLVGITPSALIRAILETAMNVDSEPDEARNHLYGRITRSTAKGRPAGQ